jgi:hypothetical protein
VRAKRSDLEKLVSECVIKAVLEVSPHLRRVIRDALDKGAKPADLRKRLGCWRKRPTTTAMTCDWLIDEWERDKGLVKPQESIDPIERLQ